VRKDILNLLRKDAQKLNGDPRDVLFCFMCDPYQSDEFASITRQALEICEQQNLRVQVLTKAGHRAKSDFDILARNNWKFGSTITFMDERLREEYEPGALSINSRIEAVKKAHSMGVFTWVSIEPVIDPKESLKVIDTLKPYVDLWKVGKLNHNQAQESTIDWKEFHKDVVSSLKGRQYYIKADLLKYAS
jgi:DNA repair photolyase